MLVDTHTHLYLDDFLPDKNLAVDRAIASGVEKMLFPNVDLSTVSQMRELHKSFPDNTYMAMGLHPTEINDKWEGDLARIHSEFMTNRHDYIAVGEIGIDLYWDKTFRTEQMEAFAIQCGWAADNGIPIIIHCRDGLKETLEVLNGLKTKPNGVFHSFGGRPEDVDRIRECGDFFFGINGIVTFKNSKLFDSIHAIGIDRIILETDSPYLSPVPFRGKRNESSYILYTAAKVAEIFGITVEEVAAKTTDNAETLFSL